MNNRKHYKCVTLITFRSYYSVVQCLKGVLPHLILHFLDAHVYPCHGPLMASCGNMKISIHN